MNYTQGPWKVGTTIRLRHTVMDSNANDIALVKGEFELETQANTNLIAASPEMLEALELVLEICSKGPVKTIKDEYGYPNYHVSTEDIQNIVAEVIKKAKGA